MKSVSSFLSCCLVALGLTACGTARDNQAGSTFCFNCHSETSALGVKIKWAEAGYDNSVHARGQVGRLYNQLAATGACPPFTVAAGNTTCAANSGTSTATASAAGVCTMPANATQAACALAGGTWAPPADPRANPLTGVGSACPPFSQVSPGTLCTTVFGGGAYTPGTLTCQPTLIPPATYVSQNACQSAGGTWVGPAYVLEGTEFEGTNSFYANSGGCQICHTQEGYRKRIAGEYDDDGTAAARYNSIKFAWDPNAQIGSPTSFTNPPTGQQPVVPTPLTRAVITNPSPLGCFGCHTPHGIGTVDNVHLDQSIPVGTTITTQSGGVWGSNKAKGHICAECHQIRQNANSSTIAGILANLTGPAAPKLAGQYNVSASYGTHHGPQTDMNLGKGGAQYSLTATCGGTCPGTFTFNGTYGNSPHTANVNADCISCHMQSDYSDINVTGSFSVNAAVGGHSFTNKGIVHGSEKALVIGCGSVTDTIGCHTVAGVATSSGNRVVSASVGGPLPSTCTATNPCTPFMPQTLGYLQKGDAYFQKLTGTAANSADSNYHLKMNELLSKLANPSADCTGLLLSAATTAGGKFNWTFMDDGVTVDPRCIDNGTTTGINRVNSPGPADDNTNASVRFLKALWNFKFSYKEDKSFGVHNTTYALELLYDSCTDLALLTGKDCGANPGRCSFCEGTYVTARP